MSTRIKELRLARGLTVEALGKLANVSKSHMSDLENGKKPLLPHMAKAVAKALGTTPLDLMDPIEMGQELIDHIHRMRRLSAADRASVIRHAEALPPLDPDPESPEQADE